MQLEHDFGWALRSVSLAFQAGAIAAVSHLPSGPRGYLVLLTASEASGESQLTIARRLGLDKTVMTYLVDALVDHGLIVREPDPADRRVRRLVLTGAGQTALDTARAQISAVETELLSSLSAEGAVSFRTMLAAIASSPSAGETSCD